jgi:hypothetical protein
MFYNTDHSFWYMAVYWAAVTVVFGVSLHFALKGFQIEIEPVQEIVVIVVSALAALVPAVGPYLAFIVGMYLLYRMADAGLGMIIGAVAVTRLIAMFIALGLLRAMVTFGLIRE